MLAVASTLTPLAASRRHERATSDDAPGCRAAHVSTATVLRRWRAGELPGYRLSSNVLRFDAAEVDAWLAERRGPPFGPTGRSTYTGDRVR